MDRPIEMLRFSAPRSFLTPGLHTPTWGSALGPFLAQLPAECFVSRTLKSFHFRPSFPHEWLFNPFHSTGLFPSLWAQRKPLMNLAERSTLETSVYKAKYTIPSVHSQFSIYCSGSWQAADCGLPTALMFQEDTSHMHSLQYCQWLLLSCKAKLKSWDRARWPTKLKHLGYGPYMGKVCQAHFQMPLSLSNNFMIITHSSASTSVTKFNYF